VWKWGRFSQVYSIIADTERERKKERKKERRLLACGLWLAGLCRIKLKLVLKSVKTTEVNRSC
jgi:hypothetical protein